MNPRALKILCVGLGLCATAGSLAAQVTLTNLHSFGSFTGDGERPLAGLVQGSDGNFYGTTSSGGIPSVNGGTVFRISEGGSYSNLYLFDGTNGASPKAGLVEGSPGYFYGTTSTGGTNNHGGTVFKLNTDGNLLTILYPFSGGSGSFPGDGKDPEAGLVQGSNGYFYGTTRLGGPATGASGTIYRTDPTGSDYAILHSFTNNPDGTDPRAGLVQGSDGNFYGTTSGGGTNGGSGTVFRISPSGSYTNLHSFGSLTGDGEMPLAGVVQGADGNLYGTTYTGATSPGIVFRISPSGSYSNLYSFTSATDGTPSAGLVQGSDGNFYGTTSAGSGGSGNGTVFRISPGGSYLKLYSFTGPSDGKTPLAGLVQGSDGNFYGTTESGGTNGHGNIFKLIVPLNPPANQISAVQVVGTDLLVTIPSVAAETYQLQYRDSLTAGAWSNVAGAFGRSLGGPLTMTNFGGVSSSQRFYRFAITP